jgi:hypothetical protein
MCKSPVIGAEIFHGSWDRGRILWNLETTLPPPPPLSLEWVSFVLPWIVADGNDSEYTGFRTSVCTFDFWNRFLQVNCCACVSNFDLCFLEVIYYSVSMWPPWSRALKPIKNVHITTCAIHYRLHSGNITNQISFINHVVMVQVCSPLVGSDGSPSGVC